MQEIPLTRHARPWRLFLTMVFGVSLVAGCSSEATTTTATSPPSTTTAAPVAETTTTSTTLAPTTTSPPTTTTTTTTTPPPTTTQPDEIPERSLLVPPGPAPTIDGVIADGEWTDATTASLSNGDQAYWQRDEATLYVALDGTELGAVNLVIATPGELWILHSSAALGSSLYVPGESAWEQSHGYSWCCRSATDDTARLGLFDDEGWQANIGFTGDVGVVEYQVAIPWGYSMAAIVYHTEDRDSAYWPADLSTDAAAHITENRWTDPTLDPADWWMLVPGPAG